MRTALSIAGSDPTGGAGLQQDLQVFRSFGVHGCGVVSALTVQDTQKVHQVLPVFPSVVLAQLRTLLHDVTPSAVKLGMLASDDVLRVVERGLDGFPVDAAPPLVIDPVLRSSSGAVLLESRAIGGLTELIGRATLVTPNLAEAERLTGEDVSTRSGTERAARVLVTEIGASAALVTGGHRPDDAADCLAQRTGDDVAVSWLEGERIPAPAVHGTGCALSAAITAALAQGDPLEVAVRRARAFLRSAIAHASRPGSGAALLGIVDAPEAGV